jgi:hypothetical protein
MIKSEVNLNIRIGAGDPSLTLRDDTLVLWYRVGEKVAIRKLLFDIHYSLRIATFSPSVIPKSSVILKRSEGSPSFSRNSN